MDTLLGPVFPVEYAFANAALNSVTRSYRIAAREWLHDTVFAWAVTDGALVLTKSGDWVCEPGPSSRTEGFLADTRWKTLSEAAEAARAAARVEVDQRTPIARRAP